MRLPGLPDGWRAPDAGNGLRLVAGLGLLAVLFQVAIIPRLDVGPLEAIPNLVVATVVAVGAYRGVVVGAAYGFATGMLVELFTPGETLGVLALVYVAIGAWCGRFAASPEPPGRLLRLLLVAGAATAVPIWFGIIGALRGQGPPLGYLIVDVALPQLVFSLLVSAPAWGAARRMLGTPREVEPWLVPA